MQWSDVVAWFSKFLDPQALVQDRVHAFIFVVVIGGLWRWFKGWKPGKRQVFAMVGLYIIAAFLLVSLLAGVASPQKEAKGGVRVYVKRAVVGKYQGDLNSTLAIFVLRLANAGPATVAWNWKLITTFHSGDWTESNAEPYPSKLDMRGNKSEKPIMELTEENYLPSALFRNPMDAGSGREGWVAFLIKGYASDSIQVGVKFRVEFEDAHEHKISVDHLWTGPIEQLGGE